MTYASGWLWNHGKFVDLGNAIHTFSVGAARPSDLDQPAIAAYLQGKGELLSKVQKISNRLRQEQINSLGQDWLDTCHVGLVKSDQSKYLIEHNQIIWFYNCIKSYGLLEFCRDRYHNFTNNQKKWDDTKSQEENIDNCPRHAWGFTPGLPPKPNVEYFEDDLCEAPEEIHDKIREAYDFVLKWCPRNNDDGTPVTTETPPIEWQTAYDMKPWKDFPDR